MSNYIYSVNTLEENINDIDSRLASKGYVDALVKQVEDTLIDYINKQSTIDDPNAKLVKSVINKNNFSNGEEIIIKEEEKVIRADDIVTNPSKRFIDDRLIRIFKEKPSKFDMDNALAGIRNDFQLALRKYIDNLLNTPDSLQRLHDFANLLKEDDVLDAITEVLAKKVEFTDLEAHASNSFHLNNNDRKALNLLLSYIETGVADWNAAEGEPNYIANKPESLKANGGNADTVGGYYPHSLLNRRPYDLVIGNAQYVKCDDEADIIVDKDGNLPESLNWVEIFGLNYTSFFFKNGKFCLNKVSKIMNDNHIIISGCDNSTEIIGGSILFSNTTVRDMLVNPDMVSLTDECKFFNVTFKNCTIYVEKASLIMFNGCTFIDCVWYITPPVFNGFIVTGCIFNGGKPPVYNTNTSLITNNLIL